MIKYPDVALLLQGPINDFNKVSFFCKLDYYKTLFDEIVISTYTEHINDSVQSFCKEHNIRLVTQTENIGKLNYLYNIGHHTLSILAGLSIITKKYTLKHRVDEFYSNLELLIELLMLDDEKWVSSTTVFGIGSYCKFHAGDHLFCAKTSKLYRTFQLTKENLVNNVIEFNRAGEPAPEVTFTKNFIRISGATPHDYLFKELMLKWFDLIPDYMLHPFLIRINHFDGGRGKIFTEPDHCIPSTTIINSINDVVKL